MSQSLWNRAVSYDKTIRFYLLQIKSLNPFGTGQCLTTEFSSDTWRRANSLNPFGTGQCLTTAVGSSSLVRQGLPKPLPNFFRDSESWGLIWLNVEQILTFHQNFSDDQWLSHHCRHCRPNNAIW